MNGLLRDTSHRDAPPPARPWALAMRWDSLLFAHWPVPPRWLAGTLPPGLEPDLHDGCAWLGVVPFVMRGTRPRFVPAVPGASSFPELNLRTYVRHPGSPDGRPGVWFYSLDAGNRLVVRLARAGFHLPYFDARFDVVERLEGGWTRYAGERTHRGAPAARFEARYRPTGPVMRVEPGSLEAFLTERWRLYAADAHGFLYRCEIHHRPWALQPAEADLRTLEMTSLLGAALPQRPPLLHYAERTDVIAWLPQRVPEGVPLRRPAVVAPERIAAPASRSPIHPQG